MKNTMLSIIKYFRDNFTAFGLSSKDDLKTVERPKSPLVNGGRRLTVLSLRTLRDTGREAPFAAADPNEKYVTLVEMECKARSANPGEDFLWNEVWAFRDVVYGTLAGPEGTGIVIPRYNWADPQNLVPDGEIWFKVDPGKGEPLEKNLEDPEDAANKSIYLTYYVHWWRALAETQDTDSWLEALALWTQAALGAEWAVYRSVWPSNYRRPCVLWRATGVEAREKGQAMYELKKKFAGHVLGRTPNEQRNGVLSLIRGLQGAVKIVLDSGTKRYLKVAEPKAGLQEDALLAGQVTVSLSRLETRPAEEAPLMQKIEVNGEWR
jgi:hypothetical protein